MKKILIISGILLIVILSGVWVYLLFFSETSSESGSFSLFNFGDTTDITVPESSFFEENTVPLVDVASINSPLRQLTTKPVVGYLETQPSASSAPLVYYVEAGTGHVFTIDLDTGVESRVSNITVPAVRTALFSFDGTFVAMSSEKGSGDNLTVIRLPDETIIEPSSFSLSEDVFSFQITSSKELLYAVKNNSSVSVKSLDLITKNTSGTLFTIPFEAVTISWGDTLEGPHYYQPKPNSYLPGYLYAVNNYITTRTPVSGYGLRTVHSKTSVLFSTSEDNLLSLYDESSNEITPLYLKSTPEKCAGEWSGTTFMCGIYKSQSDFRIDDWYSGEISLLGNLREIDTEQVEIQPVIDISSSGRDLDISKPVWNGNSLLFTNKQDKSLWMYSTN